MAEEKENMFIPDSEGFIIDPIDGTLNYINGIPHCAVCIAYVNHRSVQCSVVYNPFSNELFYASKGNGAYLNGERIYCLSNNFNRSIVLVDDCWDGDARVVTNYVAGFRCIGCAELKSNNNNNKIAYYAIYTFNEIFILEIK